MTFSASGPGHDNGENLRQDAYKPMDSAGSTGCSYSIPCDLSTRSSSNSAEWAQGSGLPKKSAKDAKDAKFAPLKTNLNAFHRHAVFDTALSTGSFTKVKHISDCCRKDGHVELHQFKGSKPETVVVKRVRVPRVACTMQSEESELILHLREAERNAEDCLNEIGIYCFLSAQQGAPKYILRMLTAFLGGSDVWLVLEQADGGDLFSLVQAKKGLEHQVVVQSMWELLQGVTFLHHHGISHRDISLENVLIHQGSVRLMDFGQAVLSTRKDGVAYRYFRSIGKPYYRPAECYVPPESSVNVQAVGSVKEGDIVFGQTDQHFLCEVKLKSSTPGRSGLFEGMPWGYASTPVDIFACGVCAFIMVMAMPAFAQAKLSDQHFLWLATRGLPALLAAWRKELAPELTNLLSGMMALTPSARPHADACLQHSAFQSLRNTKVPRVQKREAPATDMPACLLLTQAASQERTYAESTSLSSPMPGENEQFIGEFYAQGEAHRNAESMETMSAGASVVSFGGEFYTQRAEVTRSLAPEVTSNFDDGEKSIVMDEWELVEASEPLPLPTLSLERNLATECCQKPCARVASGAINVFRNTDLQGLRLVLEADSKAPTDPKSSSKTSLGAPSTMASSETATGAVGSSGGQTDATGPADGRPRSAPGSLVAQVASAIFATPGIRGLLERRRNAASAYSYFSG